jgi:hypothetical protein
LCSVLPHLYFKSGIIDPWFNFFIVFAILQYSSFAEHKKSWHLYLSVILIGLAVLTKGPVALLLYGLTILVYSIINKFSGFPSIKQIGISILLLAMVCSMWILPAMLQTGTAVLKQFIDYQVRLLSTADAGHGGPWFYHIIVLLVGLLPASVIFIGSYIKRANKSRNSTAQLMHILFWIGLIVFSIVKTKIVHYSSICYLPLTYLAALYLNDTNFVYTAIPKGLRYFFSFIILLVILILCLLPVLLQFLPLLASATKDQFTIDTLKINYHWHWTHALAGLLGLCCLLYSLSDKKQYYFSTRAAMFIFVLQACIYTLISPAEEIAQGAEIEHIQFVAKKDAYLATDYQNYGRFFYKGITPQNRLPSFSDYNKKFDKDLYLLSRSNAKERLQKEYPFFRLVREKNGYLLWLKEK